MKKLQIPIERKEKKLLSKEKKIEQKIIDLERLNETLYQQAHQRAKESVIQSLRNCAEIDRTSDF